MSVVATDDRGVAGIENLEIRLQLPNDVHLNQPRLVIRSIGVDSFQGPEIPRIHFATEDARQVADFLAAPEEKRWFPDDHIDEKTHHGPSSDLSSDSSGV